MEKDIFSNPSHFDLMFGQSEPLNYLDIKFDFKINPQHFMKWLKSLGEETIGGKITGDYKTDCGSMCEFSCLYVAMLLHEKELKGELVIYYGKFGFWEHYWLGYKIGNEEYFIDLTLKQFKDDAPELAIVKAHNERVAGRYSSLSEGEPIEDYILRQRAFMFYTNPITMEQPPKQVPYTITTTFDENIFDNI